MAHNRVNMINFIRAVEPRLPIDLLGTLQEEIALVRRHRLPATWLIQYDALVDPQYVRLLKEALDETQEIGIWFEVVQPLVEDAGLPWRGRYPWDWHANVGFSIGYTPEQRRRLADVFMERCHRTFGYYPRSAGRLVLGCTPAGISQQPLRHRGRLQLQGPVGDRRIYALGRLLSSWVLPQPSERLYAGAACRRADSRPGIPYAGQRPDLPV